MWIKLWLDDLQSLDEMVKEIARITQRQVEKGDTISSPISLKLIDGVANDLTKLRNKGFKVEHL